MLAQSIPVGTTQPPPERPLAPFQINCHLTQVSEAEKYVPCRNRSTQFSLRGPIQRSVAPSAKLVCEHICTTLTRPRRVHFRGHQAGLKFPKH